MAIGTPVPHRGGYLLLEIALCLIFGPPILYALVWIVSEAAKQFSVIGG